MRSWQALLQALTALMLPLVGIAEQPRPAGKAADTLPFHVQGLLVDEHDRPIAGAMVESLQEGTKASSMSDDAGRFVLELVRKPAALLLRASDSRGRQAFAAYLLDERARFMLDRFLPRAEPGLPDEIKLVARPSQKIEAVVVDEGGKPVADAQLFLHATWNERISEAKTDAGGKATLLFPRDAPLSSIVAMKRGVGLDYFLFRSPIAEAPDRYRLAPNHREPLTFVLNGSRRITVRVVDEAGQPLADVKVSPFRLEKPQKGKERELVKNVFDGGALYTHHVAAFSAVSDVNGAATFDFIPVDCIGGFSFGGDARDRMETKNAFVEAGGDDAETTLTLIRTFPLRGRVTFDDGRPAAGAMVHVMQMALDDSAFAVGAVTAATNDEGEFNVEAYPNHVQWLNISRKEWVAPLTSAIVLNEPPESLNIVLQKATRVYGRLTAGPDNRPVPNQQISIFRRAEDLYQQLHDRGFALPRDRANPGIRQRGPRRALPADAAPAASANPILMYYPGSTSTDLEGQFQVFLGPGKYQLRYGETALDVELNGEVEHEANLHAEGPVQVEFVGRVVFEGREQRGVADARVRVYFLSKTKREIPIDAATNDKGEFRFARHPVDMLLYARDEGGRFAQIVRVAPDDKTATITLAKAASAHGRLIDAATGDPIAYASVGYSMFLDGETKLYEKGLSVQTDKRGEFTIAGLVPGQKYTASLFRNRPLSIATIEPTAAEVIELGDFRFDMAGKVTRGGSDP